MIFLPVTVTEDDTKIRERERERNHDNHNLHENVIIYNAVKIEDCHFSMITLPKTNIATKNGGFQ